MSNIRSILLRHIRQDGGTQARAKMDQTAIDEYAEAMKGGATFPPVIVFEDKENILWLGDGFHRAAAAEAAGKKNIRADIRSGGLREARLFAIGANITHGVRRSNADKRLAVSLLLDDPEWSVWSNREIARHAGVSEFLVRDMKEERVRLNRTADGDKVLTVSTLGPGLGPSDDSESVQPVCNPAPQQAPQPTLQEQPEPAGEAASQQVDPAPGPGTASESGDPGPDPAPEPDPPGSAAAPAPPQPGQADQAEPLASDPENRDAYVEMLIRVNKEKDAQIAELTRKLEEAATQVQELSEENESYRRTLDAEGDDLLARFDKECKRNQERARLAEDRLRGIQGENRDLQHYCKMWKSKFERLDKARKKAGTTPAPEPEPLAEVV